MKAIKSLKDLKNNTYIVERAITYGDRFISQAVQKRIKALTHDYTRYSVPRFSHTTQINGGTLTIHIIASDGHFITFDEDKKLADYCEDYESFFDAEILRWVHKCSKLSIDFTLPIPQAVSEVCKVEFKGDLSYTVFYSDGTTSRGFPLKKHNLTNEGFALVEAGGIENALGIEITYKILESYKKGC